MLMRLETLALEPVTARIDHQFMSMPGWSAIQVADHGIAGSPNILHAEDDLDRRGIILGEERIEIGLEARRIEMQRL